MTATITDEFQQIVEDVQPVCMRPCCSVTAHWVCRHTPCGYSELLCDEHADVSRGWLLDRKSCVACEGCDTHYGPNFIDQRIRDFPIEAL